MFCLGFVIDNAIDEACKPTKQPTLMMAIFAAVDEGVRGTVVVAINVVAKHESKRRCFGDRKLGKKIVRL